MEVDCKNTNFQIGEGDRWWIYCGDNKPEALISSGNKLEMLLEKKGFREGRGFECSYDIGSLWVRSPAMFL